MSEIEYKKAYDPKELAELGLSFYTTRNTFHIIFAKGTERYIFTMTNQQLFLEDKYDVRE